MRKKYGSGTYFSACRTITPVMKSIGIPNCIISTRIREVTDISPPLLYKSCFQVQSVHTKSTRTPMQADDITYCEFCKVVVLDHGDVLVKVESRQISSAS